MALGREKQWLPKSRNPFMPLKTRVGASNKVRAT
jgi:hypothetical protein